MEKKRAYIYAKAASGRTVRVPVENYERWKKTQEAVKAGTYTPDPARVEALAALMRGEK